MYKNKNNSQDLFIVIVIGDGAKLYILYVCAEPEVSATIMSGK